MWLQKEQSQTEFAVGYDLLLSSCADLSHRDVRDDVAKQLSALDSGSGVFRRGGLNPGPHSTCVPERLALDDTCSVIGIEHKAIGPV